MSFDYCNILRSPELKNWVIKYCNSHNMDSDSVFKTIETRCNLNPENSSRELTIYPNPTKAQFNIKGKVENQLIQVFDMNGSMIRELNFDNQTLNKIDFGDLPNGIYLFKYQVEDKLKSKRLIIQK